MSAGKPHAASGRCRWKCRHSRSGCHPRRKAVFGHLGQWRDAAQPFNAIGMRCAVSPVEKSRFARQQRAGADGNDCRIGTHRAAAMPPAPAALAVSADHCRSVTCCPRSAGKHFPARSRASSPARKVQGRWKIVVRHSQQCIGSRSGCPAVPRWHNGSLRADRQCPATAHVAAQAYKGNDARAASIHQAASLTVANASLTLTMRAKRPASTSSVRLRISSGLKVVPEACVIGKVSVASVT